MTATEKAVQHIGSALGNEVVVPICYVGKELARQET